MRTSLLIIGGLVAASATRAQTPAAWRNLSAPSHPVTTDFSVMVPMRDGVHLAANIVRPTEPGRYPVVINYIPYGKDPSSYFAVRGYIAIFAEQRGTGQSEGAMKDYFDAQSFQDGYDLVEWAANQPWSDGKIGLWGISFGAINATRVAALRPPHLKALAVNSAYANFYGDHWYPGGVRSNHPYVWHGAPNLLYTMLRGPVYDDGKGGKTLDLETWKRHLNYNGWAGFFRPQWDHNSYDAYWQEKDLRSKYATFEVPTLQVANFFDHARNHDEAYQNYLVLKAKKVPQKLIAGPWTHGAFGPTQAIDFEQTMLAWFDHFLKGINTGITEEPPVSVFVMRENRWRAEEDWPIARTTPTRYFLTASGSLTTRTPGPAAAPPRRFTYHPWVGSAAGPYGTWFNAGYSEYIGLPDQRPDEAESLTFTSDALAAPTEVTGMPAISFYATSTAKNTDFTIKLSDVQPDGRSDLVTRGWINSSYRESNLNPARPEDWKITAPTPIIPGKVYRYRVTLQNIAYQFKPGHRIRVTIASSDWPSNWPNPLPARNEIRFESPDGDRSSIVLPIVPARPTPLAEPYIPLAAPREQPPRPDDAERFWIENDLTAGKMIYRSTSRSERPVPGGTMTDESEWRIDLTKTAPYRQSIDLKTTWIIRRPGKPDVRFVYRVVTDSAGPRPTLTLTEGPTP